MWMICTSSPYVQHSNSGFAHRPARLGMFADELKRSMNGPLDVLRAWRASFSDVVEDGAEIANRP
jgi:hypothetical protein